MPALLPNLGDANGAYSEQLLGQQEIWTRLLLLGMHFHQHDIGRIVSADNRVVHELLVTGRIQSTQEIAKFRVEAEDIDIRLRYHWLIRVERREGLQFDEFRLQLTCRVTHEAEIHLDEHRVRRFVRHAKLCGNRRF